MKAPRMILFLSDQHRADVLGCAGDPRARTPHLDRLADQGTRFSNAFCNSPVCGPSRMSMLTGLLPTTNGVLTNRHALPSNIPTIAHVMAAAGYDTVLCGRMHFIGPDQRHGFQERLVGDIGPADAAFRELDLGPYTGFTGQGREMLKVSGPGSGPSALYDREVVDAALERLAAQPEDRPLFLVVGTHAPHNPYVCSKDLYDFYYEHLPPPDMKAIREFHAGTSPAIRSWWTSRNMEAVTSEEIRRSRAAYYGMVEEMDLQVGRLLEKVDPARDLFLYTSDHGDMAGEHGMFWKSCFLDGAVKVPMIWRGPDVECGRDVSEPVSLLDLAPTFAAAAEADGLYGAEGDSLLQTLRGGPTPKNRMIEIMLLDARSGPSHMMRTETGSRVHHSRFPDEVVGVDPGPPKGWNDAEMERVLEEVSHRGPVLREAALRSGESLGERWRVDPGRLKQERIQGSIDRRTR